MDIDVEQIGCDISIIIWRNTMYNNLLRKFFIFFALIFLFTFLPQIIPSSVSIARASEIDKEKNSEYRLNIAKKSLNVGESFTLRVFPADKDTEISFKSDNSDIVTINEDGRFIANKVGSTILTATIKRGIISIPLSCDVTVGPPAFSLKMTRSIIILGKDQSDLLDVIIKPANTTENAMFISNDSTIASISSGGRITAKKVGMIHVFAFILATDSNGNRKNASCSVIVSAPDDAVLINDYLANHSELSLISKPDLSNALFEFFNSEEVTSVNNKANETPTPSLAPIVVANAPKEAGDLAAPISALTGESLIEALDKHLNSKFDLASLKEKYDKRFELVN